MAVGYGVIYRCDNAAQPKWDGGEYQVRLTVSTQSKPIAFYDGTEADMAQLRAMAAAKGAEDFGIERKTLKTGREIWTLG